MTLNVALVISGDASGARQAVQQTSADMRGLSGDARQMSTAIAAANDQAAASSERVTRTLIGQATAQRNLQAAVASFAGVRNPVDDASYRQRSADIAAYGNQLDQLRAKYNPLYAAEQAHIRNLAEIDRALKVGALSESEHAEAVRRAAAAYEVQVAGLDQVAAHALAAKLQLAEFQRQAQAAREQQKADQAQSQINQLLGVRDPRAMVGSAQASAAAFLEFPEAAEGAKNIGLASHEMTNLTYQMNDIVLMLASGQSPFMMMMQQGSQVTQIMGKRGLGEILPAIGTALTNLISPTTLLLAGVTAGGYAAYAAYRLVVPEVEELSTIMERHRDLLDSIKEGWHEAGEEARRYAREPHSILMSRARDQNRELQERLTAEAQNIYSDVMGNAAGPVIDLPQFLPSWMIGKSSTLGPIYDEIMKLREGAKEGAPDFRAFRLEMNRIADDPGFSDAIREKARELRDLTQELAKAQGQLLEFGNANDRFPTLMSVGRDTSGYGLWQSQQDAILKRMRQDQAAELAALSARSPAERAEAARLRAENEHNDESAPVRRLRIEQAAASELARAYHELSEAQRQRLRALDETIASARLDVELIGKSEAETARLRMEHELLAQVRAAAADAGVEADEAEIARIREKAGEYGRLRALQAAGEMLRDQGEEMQRLRVEQALLGTSEAVRNRLIERMEVEQEIRRQGIDTLGEEAARLRSGAEALADYRTELERQSDAWDTVRNAGESAIDGIVDSLMDGDWKGALKSLSDEILKTSMELAVKNPLKNALFGTNYGTSADLGSGWLSRLLGGGDMGAADRVASILGGSSVGAMSVSAGVVNINGNLGVGGGLGSLGDTVKRLLGGANDNALPAGDASIMSRIWNFFSGKGLQSHQVAGIMGNIGAESAFNPAALNPSSGAYGLFQHLGSRLTGLGSGAGLQQQLEYAWNELLTSEKGVLKNLLSSTNVREATGAFAGFERAEGWSKANPEGIALWQRRLAGSEAALERFAGTAAGATQDLGQFGSGLGQLGNALSQFPAAPGGGGALGALGSLFGGLSSSFAGSAAYNWLSANPGGYIGLYSDGGWTGPGRKFDPKGIVHAEEYVFSAEATRAIGVGNLERLHESAKRGFATGGYGADGAVNGGFLVGAPSAPDRGGAGGLNVRFEIVDRVGVSVEQAGPARQDASGELSIPMLINEVETKMVSSMNNGALGRATAQTFGLARKTR